MALPRPVGDRAYEDAALGSDGKLLELWNGVPLEKPPVSFLHGDVANDLAATLAAALPRQDWRVRSNSARLRTSAGGLYIPDVAVVPAAFAVRGRTETPDRLEVYDQPVALVVEVWSPTTGRYDVRVKLAGYRERGDGEIWRLHPFERTLIRWVRGEDGSYAELIHTGGAVELAALPGVAIDLDALFEG